jgi:hypothetical protein
LQVENRQAAVLYAQQAVPFQGYIQDFVQESAGLTQQAA